MAKKSLKTSDRKRDQHDAAYSDHINHREAPIASAGADIVHAQVTSRPLNEFVQKASLRTTDIYDWKTGTIQRKALDVMENAVRHQDTLHIRTVTSGRHDKKEDSRESLPACVQSSGRRLRGY
jgi:hypothetical protein